MRHKYQIFICCAMSERAYLTWEPSTDIYYREIVQTLYPDLAEKIMTKSNNWGTYHGGCQRRQAQHTH